MKIKDKATFDKANIFGQGEENSAFAQYFTGNSYLNPLTKPSGGGQILICTAGSGWYQEEGKEPVSLEPGAVIVIPP